MKDASPITVIAAETAPVVRYIRALNAEIGRLVAREGQLEAQMEVLEITISRLRCVCDAAFSVVRDDGAEDGWTTWQELVSALEDAKYEPRVDCEGVDCERQGAVIVHRPSCDRWEP